MKFAFLLTAPFFFLVSCKNYKIPNEITIEGQVKNIPDGKIYLSEAHDWKTPLYWTECRSGHFVFKIKTDLSFVPYMAAIHFSDNTKPGKMGGLLFRNYMFGRDSMKNISDGFYLESGYTRIEGDNASSPFLRVHAGRETDVMYKNQQTEFGWLGNVDSLSRAQRIAFFKKEIETYPFSYFLLRSVYKAKEQYTKEEIKEILALFNTNVQSSKLGEQFKTYFTNRPDPNQPYPNLFLSDASNQRHYIFDKTVEITMLVFWASWCGPCRREIPLLKELQKKHMGKGLNLVSISIDESKEDWTKALDKEQMNWPQYIVDNDQIDQVKQQFNFSAIPLIVFTNNEGKEIQRFIGYEKEQKKNYESVIKKFIK